MIRRGGGGSAGGVGFTYVHKPWGRRASAIIVLMVLALLQTFVALPVYGSHVDPLGALWHFDEGTGATTVDSTGHTTAGTLNGPSWVIPSGARFGRALDFDGVDDYVSVPTSSEITPTTAITVESWIDGDTLTTTWAAVAKRIGSEDIGYALEMDHAGNRICFWVFTDTWRGACRNYPSVTDTSTPISTGAWHHIAGTYDGSSVKAHLDGAVEYSLAAAGDIQYGTTGITDLAIGRDPIRSGQRFFDGRIDEVRIWNQALSSGEIGESFALGEAANNANYDTILTHQAGSGVFIFTSAFHSVDGSDNIKFRLMGVDDTAAIDGSVGNNGITTQGVTPSGGTWTLDSVIAVSPAATERDIDPGIPGGSPTAKNLILTANLGDGTKLGFTLHTTANGPSASLGSAGGSPVTLYAVVAIAAAGVVGAVLWRWRKIRRNPPQR